MNKLILVGFLTICVMSIYVEGQKKVCPKGLIHERICDEVCVPTCSNSDIRCANPTRPYCPMRCVCPHKLYLNDRGRCVRLQDCPARGGGQ